MSERTIFVVDDNAGVRRLGVIDFIEKPFDDGRLLAGIDVALFHTPRIFASSRRIEKLGLLRCLRANGATVRDST